MKVSIKEWWWTKRKAMRIKFTLWQFDYAIGIYTGFPLTKPWAWRSITYKDVPAWQIDFLWLSLARKKT
jgi:hypothetical protein